MLFLAYRAAYLFERARLKSYSGSISSWPRVLARALLVFFFIVPALSAGCLPGADDTYCVTTLGEHYHEQSLSYGFASRLERAHEVSEQAMEWQPAPNACARRVTIQVNRGSRQSLV